MMVDPERCRVRILPSTLVLLLLAGCSKSAPSSTAPEQKQKQLERTEPKTTAVTKAEPRPPREEEASREGEADKERPEKAKESGGEGAGGPTRRDAPPRPRKAAKGTEGRNRPASSEPDDTAKGLLSAPRREPAAAAVYRAGALRLAAKSRGSYELAYEPGAGPKLPALAKKLGGRPAEAHVTPFQTLAADPDAEPIQRAGELVAIALALQLEQMGWRVELALREQLAAGLRLPERRIAPSSAFRINGGIRFQTTRAEATLRGTVTFARGAAVKRVAAEARAPVKGDRKLAAEAALRDFVARVVGASGFDAALAALVTR